MKYFEVRNRNGIVIASEENYSAAEKIQQRNPGSHIERVSAVAGEFTTDIVYR